MDELKFDLWLMKLDIASTIKNRLTDCLGSSEEVYNADRKTLLDTNMVDEEHADLIIADKKVTDPDKLYEEFKKYDQKLITRRDKGFPEKLKTIPNAPYGLFYIGNLPSSYDKCVAIVGARRCSEYGRSTAYNLAKELTKRGYIIVSGMALGIDNASHQGALSEDGVSVAVFGCGVDICYPRGNIGTYTTITKRGAVISENYPETKPIAYNFPPRNRIISALANQVVIIEARERSGSLITADFALSQGRDVYALPGRICDSLSGGCNRLLEQGAGIITSIPDFINNIEDVRISTLYNEEESTDNAFSSEEDREVYNSLDFYPKSIEDVVRETNLELLNVLSAIMNLCSMGYIREAFVNQYIRLK